MILISTILIIFCLLGIFFCMYMLKRTKAVGAFRKKWLYKDMAFYDTMPDFDHMFKKLTVSIKNFEKVWGKK